MSDRHPHVCLRAQRPHLATIAICLSLAATALLLAYAPASSADERTLKATQQYSVKVKPRTAKSTQCEARVRLSYEANDADVNVRARLSNDTCAASRGEFTVVVRTRDGNATLHDAAHLETWAREDGDTVELARTYPVAKGQTLVRVNTRRVRCRCDAQAAGSDDATEDPGQR